MQILKADYGQRYELDPKTYYLLINDGKHFPDMKDFWPQIPAMITWIELHGGRKTGYLYSQRGVIIKGYTLIEFDRK